MKKDFPGNIYTTHVSKKRSWPSGSVARRWMEWYDTFFESKEARQGIERSKNGVEREKCPGCARRSERKKGRREMSRYMNKSIRHMSSVLVDLLIQSGGGETTIWQSNRNRTLLEAWASWNKERGLLEAGGSRRRRSKRTISKILYKIIKKRSCSQYLTIIVRERSFSHMISVYLNFPFTTLATGLRHTLQSYPYTALPTDTIGNRVFGTESKGRVW